MSIADFSPDKGSNDKYSNDKLPHQAVLLDEVVALFKPLEKNDNDKESYIVDCTLGFGSHTHALLSALPHIKIIAIDQDEEALAFSKERLSLLAIGSYFIIAILATLQIF